MGPLTQSDGSAEWRAGNYQRQIRIMCAVNGPIEAKIRDELPQSASLELVYRRNVGVPMIRERLIQDRLHTCLLSVLRRDLMPRSLVQVIVQLLEVWQDSRESSVNSLLDHAFCAEISEGVNAMSAALLSSGVPLSGIVTAASYAFTDGKLQRLTDGVVKDAQSLHVAAYKFVENETKIVMCESIGEFTEQQLDEILVKAEKDTEAVVQTLRDTY